VLLLLVTIGLVHITTRCKLHSHVLRRGGINSRLPASKANTHADCSYSR